MTIENYIKKKLGDCGMFEDQAQAVFDMVKADPANEAMEGRWHDELTAYPEAIRAISWMSARRCALKWIDTNCPKAWYRPLFVD